MPEEINWKERGKRSLRKALQVMSQWADKKFSQRLLIGLSIFAVLVALLEGWFCYAPHRDKPFFFCLLILQNTLKAFGFKSDITLNNLVASVSAGMPPFQLAIAYAYSVTLFIAPLCAVPAEKLTRIQHSCPSHMRFIAHTSPSLYTNSLRPKAMAG